MNKIQVRTEYNSNSISMQTKLGYYITQRQLKIENAHEHEGNIYKAPTHAILIHNRYEHKLNYTYKHILFLFFN